MSEQPLSKEPEPPLSREEANACKRKLSTAIVHLEDAALCVKSDAGLQMRLYALCKLAYEERSYLEEISPRVVYPEAWRTQGG